MRAVTVPEPGGPDALTLTTLPDPQPGPGEVVLDVAATAVNRAALLQRQGRVSYRALKRQFDLDEAYLEDLKLELIEVHQVAVDPVVAPVPSQQSQLDVRLVCPIA
jgi:NADPH:quinone reductase-like Zn-dependent oxidoreductase